MFDVSALATFEGWISLLSLSAMEIVLGIDNIVFISILTAKLPEAEQARGRSLGLMLALVTRLGLLFAISWIMRLTTPLFTLPLAGKDISGRDLILLVGGLFLVAKAVYEIHDKLEGSEHTHGAPRGRAAFGTVLAQIALLDIVFSLDSVITAVGMAPAVSIMMIAMVVAVVAMLIFAGPISHFVERHPTMKVLALSFLLLIGVLLVAEGFGQHIPQAYVYFAMAFALGVELVNLRVRPSQTPPVSLHNRYQDPGTDAPSDAT
jgi:predicted tellurium resistance membrane protein TerC